MDLADNVIDEIRTHNVIVANELAMLASDFRYDEVSALGTRNN